MRLLTPFGKDGEQVYMVSSALETFIIRSWDGAMFMSLFCAISAPLLTCEV